MMAMPICDSMVMDRPLVNTRGDTSNTRANSPHTTMRPRLRDWDAYKRTGVCINSSAFPGAQQTLGPENQDQYQKQVGQDGRDLGDGEFGVGAHRCDPDLCGGV